MILYSFISFLLIAAFLTLKDWRRGVFFLISIAAIQDPVRKLIPGAPGYLALSIMPVWFAMVFNALPLISAYRREFSVHYPQLAVVVKLFLISIIPPAIISATYAPGSWQITIIGAIFYSSLFFGVLFGYMFAAVNETFLRRILAFYCVLTAVMLVGTPFEYLGYFNKLRVLGTAVFDAVWIRHTGHGMVKLISGFYRSPDVMGWHSVTLTMLSVLLALHSKRKMRFFWIFLAGWGFVGGMLCGRRKMMYMIPIFGFVLTWLLWRVQSKRFQFKKMMLIIIVAASAGYGIYQMVGPSSDVEEYYFRDTADDPFERFQKEGLNALAVTYRQSGFWGEGLGTATQGIHHLHVARPRTWQEGGVSKVLVEIGVPGFICFLLLLMMLMKSIWTIITIKIDKNAKDFVIIGGLFAVLSANSVSFVVSGQIYGDPFIIIFISFLSGLILSGIRMVKQGEKEQRLNLYKNIGSRERPIRSRV